MQNSVRIRIMRCGTMTPPAAAYPGVPKRYVRRGRVELPEQEKCWTPRTVYALRQPRSLWEHLPIQPFYYRGVPDGPFRRTWDLLGDGSILCISTPG